MKTIIIEIGLGIGILLILRDQLDSMKSELERVKHTAETALQNSRINLSKINDLQ